MNTRQMKNDVQKEKKTCTLLMGLLVFFLIVLCALPAEAAVRTASSNGVTVAASTNKEVYVAGEAMTVEVQVTNNNDRPISDVAVQIPCPLGFQTGSAGETMLIGRMEAGETRYGSFTFIASQSITQNNYTDNSTHINITNNTTNITNTTNTTYNTTNRTENFFYRYCPEPVRRAVWSEPPVAGRNNTYTKGVNGVVRAPVVKTGETRENLMWEITLGAGALALILLLVFRRKGRRALDLMLAGAVLFAAAGGTVRAEAYESGFVNVSLLTSVNDINSCTEVSVTFMLEDLEEDTESIPEEPEDGIIESEPEYVDSEPEYVDSEPEYVDSEPEGAVVESEPEYLPDEGDPGYLQMDPDVDQFPISEDEPEDEYYDDSEDEYCDEPEDEYNVEPEDEYNAEPEDEYYAEPEDEYYAEPEDEYYAEPEDELNEEPADDYYEEPYTEQEPVTDFVDPDNQPGNEDYEYEDPYDGYEPGDDYYWDGGSEDGYDDYGYDDGSEDAYDDYGYDDGSEDAYDDYGYDDGSEDAYDDYGYDDGSEDAYDDYGYDDGSEDAYDDYSYDDGSEDAYDDYGYDDGSQDAYEDYTDTGYAAASPYYIAGDPRGSIASLQSSAAYMDEDEARSAMNTLLSDLQSAGDIQDYYENGGSWVVTMNDGTQESFSAGSGSSDDYDDYGSEDYGDYDSYDEEGWDDYGW